MRARAKFLPRWSAFARPLLTLASTTLLPRLHRGAYLSSVRPDLPQRLRKNRVLRVSAWLAVMLGISSLFVSKTRWFQVHHHRSALQALQRGLWATQPADWRSWLTLEAFYWFLYRNTTQGERMEKLQVHMRELIQAGYLEEKVLPFAPPPAGKGGLGSLHPFLTHDPGPEMMLTFSGTNISIIAPATDMPAWTKAVQAYNAAATQSNLLVTPADNNPPPAR